MRGATKLSAPALAVVALVCAACPDNPPPASTGPDGGTPATPAVELGATSTKNDLVWRRYRAFEQGLSAALALAPSELCKELGRFSCVDTVHLVALGGNDPFGQGLQEPIQAPAATTPVAVERVALSACKAAVAADAARDVPMVFLDLDLSEAAAPLDLSDEAQAFAVEDTLTNLYRRLHARDPLEAERVELRKLTVDDDGAPLSPRDFALLACFAIASTTESVFF